MSKSISLSSFIICQLVSAVCTRTVWAFIFQIVNLLGQKVLLASALATLFPWLNAMNLMGLLSHRVDTQA